MSYHSSSRSSSRATDCKVYVGDLGNGAAKGELERAFSYYGPLRTVWVARNPPGFAFVEFEDPRDAEDAVKGMDGKWVHFTKNKTSKHFSSRSITNEIRCEKVLKIAQVNVTWHLPRDVVWYEKK